MYDKISKYAKGDNYVCKIIQFHTLLQRRRMADNKTLGQKQHQSAGRAQ